MKHQRIPRSVVRAAVWLAAAAPAARADLAQPGPFSGGWRTVTVSRPDSTTFSARLHYPAVAPGGQNGAFDGSGGPYPGVSFGHGFLQSVTQYQSTCQHLATHGYLVIASESEGGLTPSHANFALDLRHSLTWLETQNSDAGSPYFGRIDTSAMGMAGHSMGGGASILATAADPRVKCLANMAAAETNPSAIAAMPSILVPVFLITGSQDTIVAPASNGLAMYSAGLGPRQYPLITGGFHCGFTDAGFLFCDSGSISRAAQLTITRRLLTAFFDLHLKGDESAWTEVWGPAAPPSDGAAVTMNPTVGFTPAAASAQASPGGASPWLTIIVSNTGPVPTALGVFAEGESGWSAEVTPTVTPVLSAGESQEVSVRLTAPGLAGAAAGSVRISARREADGGVRGWASVAGQRRSCTPDWNGIGGLTVQDLFDFLESYFQGRGDFNGVTGVSVQDIFDYLGAYFEGCT